MNYFLKKEKIIKLNQLAKLIELKAANNLLFAKRNKLISFYLFHNDKQQFDCKMKDRQRLIEYIDASFDEPFIYMKSLMPFPYYDDDIDLVYCGTELKRFQNKLISSGFKPVRDLADIREPLKKMFKHNDYRTVLHVHQEFSWNGIICLDKKTVFKKSISATEGNICAKIPNAFYEHLIAISHFIFENYYIAGLDVLYLSKLLNEIDPVEVYQEANKYGLVKGVCLYYKFVSTLIENMNLLDLPCYINYLRLAFPYLSKFSHDFPSKSASRVLLTYFIIGPLWKYLLPKARGLCEKS